jgi:Fe2+ transport system protein FeoA
MNWLQSNKAGAGEGPKCEICPLSRVQTGVEVRIRRLCAAPEIQNRLREIGLREDQVIRVLMSQTSFICQVCNARFAISAKLAQMIMVEPVLQPAPATRSRQPGARAFPG